MSALKYYAEWKDRKRISHRIEIHDVEASSGTAELIMLHKAIKKIPTFNLWEKENVCIGEGFTLELISESRLHFLPQLYTPYIKKFMVIHKINTVIQWSGWLDPEQYDDPINQELNYPITFTANNGFSVLDRVLFTPPSVSGESGICTAFDVVLHCLQQIGIPYNRLIVFIDTALKDAALTSTETVLHRVSVDLLNYFDEQGDPMTCREVLNSILFSFFCRIYIYQNDVYIIDLTAQTTYLTLGKAYSFSTGVYMTAYGRSNYLYVNEVLGRKETVTLDNAFNKVALTISQYCYQNPVTVDMKPIDSSQISSASYTVIKDDKEYLYEEKIYTQHPKITLINADLTNARFVVQEEKIQDFSNDAFIRFRTTSTHVGDTEYQPTMFCSVDPGIVVNSSDRAVMLNFDFMIERMESGYYMKPSETDTFEIGVANTPNVILGGRPCDNQYTLYLHVSVGESYLYSDGSWRNSPPATRSDLPYVYFQATRYLKSILNYPPTYDRVVGSTNRNNYMSTSMPATFTPLFAVDAKQPSNSRVLRTKIVIPLNSDQTGMWTDPATSQLVRFQSAKGGKLRVGFSQLLNYVATPATRYSFRVRSFEFTLMKPTGYMNSTSNPRISYPVYTQEDSSDLEIIGILDAAYKNDLEIETTNGTSTGLLSRSRLLYKLPNNTNYSDSLYAKNERYVTADKFVNGVKEGTIEELLLGLVLANCKESRQRLDCEINEYIAPFSLAACPLIKRNTVISSLICTGQEVDYINATSTITYLEHVKSIESIQ